MSDQTPPSRGWEPFTEMTINSPAGAGRWYWADAVDTALAQQAAQIATLSTEVEQLKKAEADFHMAYRLKCDEETKAAHIEVERLTQENGVALRGWEAAAADRDALYAELQQLRQQLDDFLKGRITKAMLLERAERAERELAQLRQQGAEPK